MRELLPTTTDYDFLGKRYWFFALSLILIAASAYLWVSQGPSKYGVDFTGGHELVVKVPAGASSEDVRASLAAAGIESPVVQSFEASGGEYSVRLGGDEPSSSVKEKVKAALTARFGEASEILRTDFVGPTVGKELQRRALVAVSLALLGILVFVSVRFEFAFAFGAVVAVFHDVIVSLGVYLLAGFTINMATVAAALTIVGYSVNDTIVIYDRVREELGRSKGESLSSIVNRSINATLSRTLITQFLTFLSVAALLFLGGAAIRDLSLFLFAGMITGTYSTIYIAAPVTIAWHKFRGGTEDVT